MKKNLIFKILVSLLFTLMLTVTSKAQKSERLDLASSPSAVMEKAVAAKGQKKFVIYLKKGQKLEISFIEDTRKGKVDFEKKLIPEGTENSLKFVASVSKDHTLTLTNPNSKATSFRVFFALNTK